MRRRSERGASGGDILGALAMVLALALIVFCFFARAGGYWFECGRMAAHGEECR